MEGLRDFVLALDVGGKVDYAAIVGLGVFDALGGERIHRCMYTDRIKGLSTTQLGDAMFNLVREMDSQLSGVIPVVDARGSGIGVFDQLCDVGAFPLGLLATTGFNQASRPKTHQGIGWTMTVSDHQLIRALRGSVAENKLTLADDLKYGDELKRELLVTTPSLSAKNKSERFDAPSGESDDLTAALLMACWTARWLPQAGEMVWRSLGVQASRASGPFSAVGGAGSTPPIDSWT